MSLELIINKDIKSAMLAKDKKKLEALRAIKSALLIEKTGKNSKDGVIPEEVELKILQRLVKQRKESAEIFLSQNRDDLAEVETYQAEIIKKYLPEQMSEDEIKKIAETIIGETGAESIKDMGRVMGATVKKVAGKADNKIVSMIVKQMLVN